MDKCIVKPIESIMLIDPQTREVVASGRPSVVTKTPFIEVAHADRKIKILAIGLPKQAQDDDFLGFLAESKGNEPLAIESFCAQHGKNSYGEAIILDSDLNAEQVEDLEESRRSKSDGVPADSQPTAEELKAIEDAKVQAAKDAKVALAAKEAQDKIDAEAAKEKAQKEADDKAAQEKADKEAADKKAADEQKVKDALEAAKQKQGK